MLRRPPTTLTLTAEDVATYEDRRFAAQAQSQTQTHSPVAHPHQTAMDTSSSSSSSSPLDGDDEDMRDAEDEEIDTSDPFVAGVTAPRRSAREQLHNRPQSPGQARAAYLQQARATRSQHPPTAPSVTAAAPSRMQRITGAATGPTPQVGATRTTGLGTTARSAAASRQGSTEPSAQAPGGRMMTRSREERIGVVGPNAGVGGTGPGAPSRRR
ncbi:hypothetical protein F4820DRAFT_450057 [Hypoxylon rubiginosum]|uniref:Uncharacterized protein n=1 Tax=Hypoxylon rubiginosum TaxID=110542 RepID=A0ACB9YW07_9PEZI|nr:hypothetical protein F4820DRAFT_450057 [Hypoxylon rubiginosum]